MAKFLSFNNQNFQKNIIFKDENGNSAVKYGMHHTDSFALLNFDINKKNDLNDIQR